MPGTAAYMVIGTTENVTSGEDLSAQTDYYRAGLYLTPGAAENALSKIKVPAKYLFLSIVKVTVRFYVCVSESMDDDEMATAARGDSQFVPPILSGPHDSVDQAEMLCLLVDRSKWVGGLVLAMTDEGALRAKRVG